MTVDMAAFSRLQYVVLEMKMAAEAADWDRFILLQQDYQQIAAQLPSLHEVNRNEERASLIPVLLQIQDALNVALPLADAWRAQLSGELAGINNAGKLSRTYQP